MKKLPPKLASEEQKRKWEEEQAQQQAKDDAKEKKKKKANSDKQKASDKKKSDKKAKGSAKKGTNPEKQMQTQKPFKQSDQKLAEAVVEAAQRDKEEGGHKFKQEVEDALAAQELHEDLGEIEEDAFEREIEKAQHSVAS